MIRFAPGDGVLCVESVNADCLAIGGRYTVKCFRNVPRRHVSFVVLEEVAGRFFADRFLPLKAMG